jgi:hypothetical protein
MTSRFTVAVAVLGAFAVTTIGLASKAAAAPSGFGNAQDTINALQNQGFNVVLNGAAVYPLSGCKVTGIEGLNSSNIDASGRRIDPTQFDTVYVDMSCRGG